MKIFDLHCDTATRLLNENQGLYDNNFHVSLKRSECFQNYAQVMAIWTHHKLSDAEGYDKFIQIAKNLENEVKINNNRCVLVRNSTDFSNAWNNKKTPLILAVEDARILQNDISKLQELYQFGVRILTLNWSENSCIGGAHNTYNGLTEFGIEVVKKCFEIGIVPDISHCSFSGAEQTLDIAKAYGKPIVASHSNSYSVSPHSRNLKDQYALDISKLLGLIGINLCPNHLTQNEHAGIGDVMLHIEHYLSLGLENNLAMGTDLDGTDLPDGFGGIEDIYKIANEMQRLNYTNELVDKIFYKNALEFIKKNI